MAFGTENWPKNTVFIDHLLMLSLCTYLQIFAAEYRHLLLISYFKKPKPSLLRANSEQFFMSFLQWRSNIFCSTRGIITIFLFLFASKVNRCNVSPGNFCCNTFMRKCSKIEVLFQVSLKPVFTSG